MCSTAILNAFIYFTNEVIRPSLFFKLIPYAGNRCPLAMGNDIFTPGQIVISAGDQLSLSFNATTGELAPACDKLLLVAHEPPPLPREDHTQRRIKAFGEYVQRTHDVRFPLHNPGLCVYVFSSPCYSVDKRRNGSKRPRVISLPNCTRTWKVINPRCSPSMSPM